MNVLSLFDGISCGRVALERGGHNVKKYYASEIDKYAIKVSEKNYPDIIRLGDIIKWRDWVIDWGQVNLVIAGSPCQGFSFAGKGLNFNDPRSKLFFVFVDILKHIQAVNPNVKFLLENVRMKAEHELVITKTLDTLPVYINSALISAQNRPRVYWTNIPGDDMFGDISQPEDKGILLKDIITYDTIEIEKFKNCVRKNIIGVDILDFVRKSGFSKIPCYGGYQDHKIGITKSPCLRAGNSFTLLRCPSGGIRQLTVVEFERLQTLPDNYTEGISNSRRYHALGNAWTVDVIVHILKGLKNHG